MRVPFVARVVLPFADRIRGTSTLEKTQFLQKSQWWNREELDSFRFRKLKQLIDHAYRNVPYYHQLFKKENIEPSDIRKVEDLTKIPKLTKSDVRKYKSDLVARNISRKTLRTGRTGGSTGEPLQLYNDTNTLSWAWAAMNRYYIWTGMRLGEGRVDLGGGSLGGYLSKGGMKQALSSILRKIQ